MPIVLKRRPMGVPWALRSRLWQELDPGQYLTVTPDAAGLRPFLFVLDAVVQHYAAIAEAWERGDPAVRSYLSLSGVELALRVQKVAKAVIDSFATNRMLTMDELSCLVSYSGVVQGYGGYLGSRIESSYYMHLRGLLLSILRSEAGGGYFRKYNLNVQIYGDDVKFLFVGPATDDTATTQNGQSYAPPQQPNSTTTTTTSTVTDSAGVISQIVKQVTESGGDIVKQATDPRTVEQVLDVAKTLFQNWSKQQTDPSSAAGPSGSSTQQASTPRKDQSKSQSKQGKAAQREAQPADKPAPTPSANQKDNRRRQDTPEEAAAKARERAEKKAAEREAQLTKENQEKLKQAAEKARAREAKKQEVAQKAEASQKTENKKKEDAQKAENKKEKDAKKAENKKKKDAHEAENKKKEDAQEAENKKKKDAQKAENKKKKDAQKTQKSSSSSSSARSTPASSRRGSGASSSGASTPRMSGGGGKKKK